MKTLSLARVLAFAVFTVFLLSIAKSVNADIEVIDINLGVMEERYADSTPLSLDSINSRVNSKKPDIDKNSLSWGN